MLFAQSGNVAVTDEGRPQFSFVGLSGALNSKIEDAYTIARLPLINAAITRADHYPLPRLPFAAKINHCVRDRRGARRRICAGADKQIAPRPILSSARI